MGKLLTFFPAEGGWLAPYLLVHLEFHSCHLNFYAADKDPGLGLVGFCFSHAGVCHETGVNLFFLSCSLWKGKKKKSVPATWKHHLTFNLLVFKIHFSMLITKLVPISRQQFWNKTIYTVDNENVSIFFIFFYFSLLFQGGREIFVFYNFLYESLLLFHDLMGTYFNSHYFLLIFPKYFCLSHHCTNTFEPQSTL